LLVEGSRTHSRWVRSRRGPAPDPLERLERVLRVSDVTLSHLSVDDLLDELLNRVREILDADTAAVLLLDEARNELVARAAQGIEEEVERGVRIPVGKGFAGRIAVERKPVVLYRVDHSTVLNPILFQKGIRSLLGVPLLAQGEVVGVMHVGTKSRRRFTRDEAELLQLVADRVALALRVRLSDRSRVVIEAFQRTFLPEVLPFLPGVRVATRYLPAATAVGVGGDWFDTFVRPEGDIALVIGDVAGHGLPAASLMGKMRNALRAHALMGGTALDIVLRADEFHRYFGRGELVTLLVGLLARDLRTFRYVSAGHPPPLVVGPQGAGAEFASDHRANPPLGLPQPPTFVEEEVAVTLGASILFYTDGLLERRNESLDVGLERLRSTAQQALDGPPTNEAVTELLEGMIEGPRPTDDVALMVLYRDAIPATELEFAVDARARSLLPIRRAVSRWLEDLEVQDGLAKEIVMAVHEASANVVEHAYGPMGGTITITATYEGGQVEVLIRDSGTWRGSSRGDRGNGLRLMRGLMDAVTVDTSEGGTSVTLRRRTVA
jgi:serine phosphatase RsbU (regulator of sigma subunit)/anti-sigma regulatory factor (Ser/Thr protein kinase)